MLNGFADICDIFHRKDILYTRKDPNLYAKCDPFPGRDNIWDLPSGKDTERSDDVRVLEAATVNSYDACLSHMDHDCLLMRECSDCDTEEDPGNQELSVK